MKSRLGWQRQIPLVHYVDCKRFCSFGMKMVKDMGIIVVPEFDMHGHSQSWFAGYPELASQPGPYRPGPRMQWQKEHPRPNPPKTTSIADAIANLEAPTFDPTNKKVYAFLDK